MDLIETVARAIHAAWCEDSWDNSRQIDRDESMHEARAAVEAYDKFIDDRDEADHQAAIKASQDAMRFDVMP